MAIEFSSKKTLVSRIGSDHAAHLRSLSRAMAKSIAGGLNERTSSIDSRSGARAKISNVTASKTVDGSNKYSIIITQRVLPDVPENKTKQIKAEQDVVRNKLSSKNGIISMLGSAGVH